MSIGKLAQIAVCILVLVSSSGCIKRLTVDPPQAAVPYTAGNVTMKVGTFVYNDVAWTAAVPGGGWLTIAGSATGRGPGSFSVAYSENPSTEQRILYVLVSTTDNRLEEKSQYVAIIQAGRPEPDEDPIIGIAEFFIFDQNLGGEEGQVPIVTGSGASFFAGCFDVLFPEGDFLPELDDVVIIPDQVGTPPFNTLPDPVPSFEPCVEAQDPGPTGEFSSGANMLGFIENGPGNFLQETGISTVFDYDTPLNLSFSGGTDIGPFNLDLRVPVQPVFILPVVTPGEVFNDFEYNSALDLPISWETSEASRGAFVTITVVANTFFPGGPIHFGQLYVATADDGAFTYTAEQLGQLPAPAEGDTLLVTLRLNRYLFFDNTVPLVAGGTGRMGVFTTASARADFRSN